MSGGFSLVEILVVIGMLGILAAFAVPRFMEARSLAAEKTCRGNRAIVDIGSLAPGHDARP